MTGQLFDALRALRKRRVAEGLKKGARAAERVFLSPRGKPIDHTNFIHRAWDRAQAIAKVRRRNWHNLRHTYASQLLSSGVSPLYVSKQLGHSQLSTTMNVYAHWVSEKGAKSEVDQLDRPEPDAKTEEGWRSGETRQ